MTAYVAYFTGASSPYTLSLRATTFSLRIAKIEPYGTTAPNFQVYKYLSSTLTGGATVTPTALRSSAAASVTTVKSNATPSGTPLKLTDQYVPAVTLGAYQPLFDFIINPGDVIHISVSLPGGGTTFVAAYFEELHLARST